MILLSKSFIDHELKKSNFTLNDLKKALEKVQSGLGVKLGYSSQVRKLSFTTRNGHARLITLLKTEEGFYIPILLRDKKDKVGRNMSSQNPFFEDAFKKMYERITEDLNNNNFDILS